MVNKLLERFSIPATARRSARKDSRGNHAVQPPLAEVRDGMLAWLCAAQDSSRTNDGGVARHYSVIDGWGPSYPETTGYIAPTFLQVAAQLSRPEYAARARRMLDWLVSIQFPDGGVQGGTVDQLPRRPVTFNTGQVLIGFSVAARTDADRYAAPMHRAAAWLRDSLDADGCWRRHPTPFAAPGEKVYETHVAWGLFEAARTSGDESYAAAGLRNLDWAISKQCRSGWFADNCLSDAEQPLTHTIGYAIRGIIEGYELLGEPRLLDAALRAARPIARCTRKDGYLSGRLASDWSAAVPWCCLTGNAQLASCLHKLAKHSGDAELDEAARRLLGYVLRTVSLDGEPGTRGGVRGSFPIDGHYGRFQYLNWAAKFTVDALLEGIAPTPDR